MPLLKSRQMVFIVLAGISILKLASTEIVVAPKDAEAVVGANVVFQCSSSIPGVDVQWNVYPVGKPMNVIYAYGKINTPYANRFTVQNGDNLNISSINIDDAGTYECRDGYGKGEKQSAELIILESNPICRSNTNLDKIVGKNTCGIEPGQVALSCSVQYVDNKAPALEWKKNGDNKTITSGVSNEIRGNRILHNLTMKGDSIANGSSYICRPAKAVSASATCNSGTITILATGTSDSGESYTVNIVGMLIIVMPILNAITASVIWNLYIRNPKQKKEKKGKSDKSLKYPIQETDSPGSKLNKEIESEAGAISDPSQENSGGSGFPCKFSTEAIIFVFLVCVPFCIGLVVLVLYRRRQLGKEKEQLRVSPEKSVPLLHQTGEIAQRDEEIKNLKKLNQKLQDEIENLKSNDRLDIEDTLVENVKALEAQLYPKEIPECEDKPRLAHKIQTNAAAMERRSINGLAVLGNELFVLHENSSEIEIYDSITYQFARALDIPSIREPFDLTTGKVDKCLFIIGLAKEAEERDTTRESPTNVSGAKYKTASKEEKKSGKQKTLPESLIGKLNAKGELLSPWPQSSGGHRGRLSTWESNLIVCLLERNVINEFSRDGDLIHTVRLSPAVA